jgi:hypothetical protein
LQGRNKKPSRHKTAYTKASKKLHKVGATSMDIAEFLTSFKKGSRKFRKILGYEKKSMNCPN